MAKKKKKEKSRLKERIIDETLKDAEFTFGLKDVKVTQKEIDAVANLKEGEKL